MTESEWQNAVEPHVMLERLVGPSNRKLRLFAVACSRRIWNLIDDLGRAAVEAAEDFADGRLGSDELRAARLACQGTGGQASWYAAATNPAIAARNAARSAQAGAVMHGTEIEELLAQANLIREIFGSPFRRLSGDQSWLIPDVIHLAQAIYYERRFADLPILADALQEAGCTNSDILNHCRGEGPHVRGCWVVDLVLGKQ